MKNSLKNILAISASILFFTGCEVERLPETNISDATFWRSESDLKTANNYLYTFLPDFGTEDNWSDDAFWAELKRRLPAEVAEQLITGATIEKSIAPLRSYVAEPMRYGNLFLAGDAAHIVPPTGARGLNTAGSDIYYLYTGLVDFYKNNDARGLEQYSEKALARVWKAQRFSWWMTTMLHTFPDTPDYDQKLKEIDMSYLFSSEAALSSLAETQQADYSRLCS